MTLFFVDPNVARVMGHHILDKNFMGLISIADVIVIVGADDDEWVTVRDRHAGRGLVVEPRRRSELLEKYYTVVRPT